MSGDARTIGVYEARAADYAARFGGHEPDPSLAEFSALLPPTARVLDLGCGPGHAALHLARAGHRVDAWDAAEAMIALVPDHPRIAPRRSGFDALTAEAVYDGVWANFSLLHATRNALPGHLAAIARALTPGGLLHLAMKTGTGEARDRLGRRYTYYTEPELRGLLAAADLSVQACRRGADPGFAGPVEPWIALRACRA